MSAVTITVDLLRSVKLIFGRETNLGRCKIWLYAGTPAMNHWYLEGNNPMADADNQQERSYEVDANIIYKIWHHQKHKKLFQNLLILI